MLLVGVLLWQLTAGLVAAQSVFDPSSFNEAQCSAENQWTTWFDSSDPSSTQGEFEVTTHLQHGFPLFMCPTPIAIEVTHATSSSRQQARRVV